jgi:peptidoglycan/xylan/chitin deacetylase (PgdA/CDA1 family)
MKRYAEDFLHLLSKLLPTGLFPYVVKRDVISLFYHAVSDASMPHVRHLYPVVPVESFRNALKYLKERYSFVTYDQLWALLETNQPLSKTTLHLSFDDGFAECYHVVRPILLEMGIPCTFFVTSDWIDNRRLYFRHLISLAVDRMQGLEQDEQEGVITQVNHRLRLHLEDLADFKGWLTAFRQPDEKVLRLIREALGIDEEAYLNHTRPYLTTAQIQEMHQAGFTIGAHGLSHRKLGFVPRDEVEAEISGSCRFIQEITGEESVPFSFPQSAGNLERDHLAEIRDRNPLIGLLFDTKDLRQDADFMVNRVWAERPLTASRKLHPLSEVMRHAYRDAWVQSVLDGLRKLR